VKNNMIGKTVKDAQDGFVINVFIKNQLKNDIFIALTV